MQIDDGCLTDCRAVYSGRIEHYRLIHTTFNDAKRAAISVKYDRLEGTGKEAIVDYLKIFSHISLELRQNNCIPGKYSK